MLTLSWRWDQAAYKAQLVSALASGGQKPRCKHDQKARQRARWYELGMNCEGVDSPHTQKPPKITATEQPKSHFHAAERTAQCRKTVHKLKNLSLKKHRHITSKLLALAQNLLTDHTGVQFPEERSYITWK